MQLTTQDLNPITWDVQFAPASFGLTMADIENTPSLLSLKTSLYAGNFSLTAEQYREVVRLSESKFQAIDTTWIFNWSVLPSVDMTWKDPWLYMTNQYFWFYDGTDWRAYIGNNGDFRFAGSTWDNYIQWNSMTDTIEIKGKIVGSEIDWWVFTSTWWYWTSVFSTWELTFYWSWAYDWYFLWLRPDQLYIYRESSWQQTVYWPTGLFLYWEDNSGTSIQSWWTALAKALSIWSANLDSINMYATSLYFNWEKVSTWLKVKCWSTTINTTGTLAITWVGFRPKFIRFQAVDWNRTWSNCDIDSFAWSHNWLRMWKISWAIQFDTTTRVAELYRDSWWTYVTIDFSSFDADWFTINRLVVDFWIDLQWTCFW